jgi:hypothetical protein
MPEMPQPPPSPQPPSHDLYHLVVDRFGCGDDGCRDCARHKEDYVENEVDLDKEDRDCARCADKCDLDQLNWAQEGSFYCGECFYIHRLENENSRLVAENETLKRRRVDDDEEDSALLKRVRRVQETQEGADALALLLEEDEDDEQPSTQEVVE